MNDSENSLGRSIKMILGTLGIFVVFGFLALILSGFAGNESAEERAYKGEFSKETTEARWANLEEVQAAQTEAFDQAKVDAALEKIGSTVAKPAKTAIVVPGSPTFLKQSEQPAEAPAEAPAEKKEPAEKGEPKKDGPAVEPKAAGEAAPEKETPKPEPVNAPEEKAKAKGDAKPKGEAKGGEKAKAESPAQPEAPKADPAPANQ